MVKEVITKRHYYSNEEVKKAFNLMGDIESITGITDYQKQSDSDIKDFNVVITTLQTVEDKMDETVFPPQRVMGKLR